MKRFYINFFLFIISENIKLTNGEQKLILNFNLYYENFIYFFVKIKLEKENINNLFIIEICK